MVNVSLNIFPPADEAPELFDRLERQSLADAGLHENLMRPSDAYDPESFVCGIHAELNGKEAGLALFHANGTWAGKKCLLAGFYTCPDDSDLSNALWHAAEAEARRLGAEILAGPVDGNTWYNYRFRQPGASSRYSGEYAHPDWYLQQWTDAGFRPVMRFHTTINDTMGPMPERYNKVAVRLGDQGIRIREVTEESYSEDSQAIFGLCSEIFGRNTLYAPITFDRFLTRSKLFGSANEKTLLAETADGHLAGFVHGYADQLEPGRFIIKTEAIRPARAYAGLGGWLTHLMLDKLSEEGYRSCLYAYMRENSESHNYALRYSEPHAAYLLMARQL